MHWYLQVLRKYAVFSGRARRKEFWMFFLFDILFTGVLSLIEMSIGLGTDKFGVLTILYSLATFLPGLAVFVRRMHDIDKSGWNYFWGIIPVIGHIILLIYLVRNSQPGRNQYGHNPKEAFSYQEEDVISHRRDDLDSWDNR